MIADPNRRTGPTPSSGVATSYDVRVWKIRTYNGKRGRSYDVRWSVDGASRSRAFKTSALAESFRAELVTATRQGSPFDRVTGLPVTMLPDQRTRTWYEHACAYVDMKWPRVAPRSRQSIADALATVTPALLSTESGRPDLDVLREALYGWAFNASARKAGSPAEHLASAVEWIGRSTLRLIALEDKRITRAALDRLATKLDGSPAAATTIARKRAVFYNTLEYAVELELLDANPVSRVKWTAPKVAETVDRRSVVNHAQARALLTAVGKRNPDLEAFFACMYYAALRPGEAIALTEPCLDLPAPVLRCDSCKADSNRPNPKNGTPCPSCGSPTTFRRDRWGVLHLETSDPSTSRAWTDTGSRQPRQLKHRARDDTRPVPCVPQLTAILRRHLATFGTTPDGRLFRGSRGGPVPDSAYGNAWQHARRDVLTPAQVESPLAARPYDLRHAAVSTWLNAGVQPTQVAEWAGHSVHVLLTVYAKCVLGQEEAAKRRIEAALATD